VVKLICKNCGSETANVICDHCGINVVWYNKWGILHDQENPGELSQYTTFVPSEEDSIEEVVTEIFKNKEE